MILDVCGISKSYGYDNILNNISFSVNLGDVVGLVGRNGCGKSTMLKIIAGEEDCVGNINIARNTSIGYLEQVSPDLSDDRIVEDIFREPFTELMNRQKIIDNMAMRMADVVGAELDWLVDKYSDMLNKFIEDGGYEIDNTINYVANGLKISKEIREMQYKYLSGGEKTLVHFARILLSNPTLLLLDETTNHLDIERIEWLQGYIQRFKGGVVIVSHDRYFLDKVTNIIIDIEDNGERYVGNYSYFVK